MHGRVSCLGLTIVGAALLMGCGGSKEESNQQAAYPMYNNQQPGANPAYNNAGQPMQQQPQTGYGQQPVQQQPVQQQPVQQQPVQQQPVQQQPVQQAAPAGVQEVDASMALPVQPLLTQMLKSQVPPGAKALGTPIVANFPAGGKLQKQVQLTLNKCYTVIAAGAPGVSEVNLSFVPNLPLATAIAVDNSQGPQATLGANPNCYKQLLFSAPMTLNIDVPAGQGLVAVQVYEK